MIKSMTGYGKAELNIGPTNITIELKSLNSKQIDISIKMPFVYRDKEIDVRKLISKKLQRGKIELSIWRKKEESSSNYTINIAAIKEYHNQILELQEELNLKSNIWSSKLYELGLNNTDIIPTLLKMPEAVQKEEYKVDEIEWNEIYKGINIAISNLIQFRTNEGKKLEEDIQLRINKIGELLHKILPLSKERIEKIKKKLSEKLATIQVHDIDESRFQQELIYYLEKQDITEEEIRLSSHLEYFLETMKSENLNGKKLGFICQEIGREINTIGSKSSDVEMQKTVVEMKDELEKIKEQLLNIV